jgi:hypothetical protein
MMGEMLLQMLLRMSGQSTPFVSGVQWFKVAVFNILSCICVAQSGAPSELHSRGTSIVYWYLAWVGSGFSDSLIR